MMDFEAPWFSKFVPPELVTSGELNVLQICCERDPFLQAFNLIDDTELEFLVTFPEGSDLGILKIIKTREFSLIEAHINFEIDKEF